MADEPDPERLRALEARIAAARVRPEVEAPSTAKGLSQGEVAYRMVIELVTGILVGVGIGYGLDVLFGTLPVFLAVFSLVGFAAGVRTMMGSARQVQEKAVAAAGNNGAASAARDERD